MPLSIKNEEVDRLARDLADRTGESLTQAILVSLKERLERVAGRSGTPGLRADVRRIQERVKALQLLDERSDDDILGYDEHGLPS